MKSQGGGVTRTPAGGRYTGPKNCALMPAFRPSFLTRGFCEYPATSSPAQRCDDVDLVRGGDRLRQRPRDRAVDVEQDGRANMALLIDHPETEAGIAPVEVGQERVECRPVRVDLGAVLRVGVERRRDVDDRHQVGLVSTEQICGRWAAM